MASVLSAVRGGCMRVSASSGAARLVILLFALILGFGLLKSDLSEQPLRKRYPSRSKRAVPTQQ